MRLANSAGLFTSGKMRRQRSASYEVMVNVCHQPLSNERNVSYTHARRESYI